MHRVDLIEKVKEVYDTFNRIEFDVVFLEAENRFDVNQSIIRLNSICEITKIKREQFIVESTKPEHLLNL